MKHWIGFVLLSFLLMACGGGGGSATDPGTPDPGVAEEEGDVGTLPDVPDSLTDEGTVPEDTALPDPGPTDPGTPDPGLSPACVALKDGVNTGFPVDGTLREFILDLPDGVDAGGPWPVIFNWHGFGDTAQNMSFLLAQSVNDPLYPFILVTPEDAGAFPDWELLQVTMNDPNPEARLFDEILACLDARFGVDPDRVHSVGFSAGGIMTDLLGVIRGDRMASLVTFSGGYLSNPANDVGDFSVVWPDLSTQNAYVQVVLSGGAKDQWSAGGMFTVNFDNFAKNDTPYLTGLGHDVIRCQHGKGHSIPFEFRAKQILEFFQAHPRGTAVSPFGHAMPADYPAYCTYEKGK